MSFFDDYEADIYWDEQQKYMEHEYSAKMGIWHTKDGKEIKIKDMETSHIKNCIAFIRRNDKIDMYEPYIKTFEEELKRREESDSVNN